MGKGGFSVKRITAYADRTGTTFPTAREALLSDMIAIVGNNGVAQIIIEKREDIEALWREMDLEEEL
jgi:hypothetical protein